MYTADIRHNSSGYYDGTAYKAIMRAERGSRKKKGKDAGIMEKYVKQKRDNIVGLAGKVIGEVEKQQDIYGARGLNRLYMEIERKSGRSDRVIVIYNQEAEETPGQIKDGAYIMVIGEMQTYKEVPGGRIVVFVLAEYVGVVSEQVEQQNGVDLEGWIARKPIHRTTPLGKKITEIMVKVPSAFDLEHYSFIPVICWEKCAGAVAKYQEDDRIALEGRLQSRDYKKHIDGIDAVLTAYEVSAWHIEKL